MIASTNKDLEEEISRGNFREDLFYRLNVIPFFVPPLRDRKEDIPLFARHFLKELAATYGRRPREITDDAIEALMRYSWPGNVRELRNVIERIVIMNPTTTRFDRKHLPPLVYRDGHRRAVERVLHSASGARRLRARLHSEKTGREPRQRQPRRRSSGPGAQPSLPQDENSGDCGERMSEGARRQKCAALPLHHVDFSSVLAELHFIHELVDEKNSAAVIGIDVFSHGASRNGVGIKTGPGSRTTMIIPRSSSQLPGIPRS